MELLKVHRTDSDGVKPQVVVSVPSVNKFLGAFADLYKGKSLCSCGGRTLNIALSLRTDGQVVASNCNSGEHKKFQITSVKYKKEEKWLNYIKGSVLSLGNQLKNFRGFTVTIEGDLLECDSSTVNSALVAGLIFGLNNLFKLKMSRDNIYSECIDVLVNFCSEVPSVNNLKTMIYSEKGKYILIDLEKQSHTLIADPFKKSDYRMLLVDGNIPPSAMKEELSYTREGLRHAIELFRLIFKSMSFKNFDEWAFKDKSDDMNEDDRKLCMYLLNEFRITSMVQKAMESCDSVAIGKLLAKTEKSIKDELELICPEIDWLIRRSLNMSSCLGCCMIYNGLGGLIAMVIGKSGIESYTSYLDEYSHIFGFDCTATEFTPVNVLKLIDLNSPALQN